MKFHNIYLIWIGDIIPNYVQYVVKYYAYINQHCNVEFIHINNNILNDIFYNRKNDFKYYNILYNSIYSILDQDFKYLNFINTQKKIYGKNIRFIQLLSDIFRLELLNTMSGIYVDCDTFPIKPFSKELFNLKNFIVERYYNTNHGKKYNVKYLDNYFIGVNSEQIYNLSEQSHIKLLQTNKNFENDIGYLYRKKLFLQQKLLQQHFSLNIGKDVQNFYIEHYHLNTWNLDSKIFYNKTPLCIFDKLL